MTSWEDLGQVTVDDLVTATKHEGSALMLRGWATPEGWPFAIVVAVGGPGKGRVVALAEEFAAKLGAIEPLVARADRKAWP